MEGPVIDRIAELERVYGSPIPKSWSANFEEDPYVDRPDLIIQDSLRAIAATHVADGSHDTYVNLITPGELGDPAGYLVPALRAALGETIELEDAGQCGCGGFVLRVWRLS